MGIHILVSILYFIHNINKMRRIIKNRREFDLARSNSGLASLTPPYSVLPVRPVPRGFNPLSLIFTPISKYFTLLRIFGRDALSQAKSIEYEIKGVLQTLNKYPAKMKTLMTPYFTKYFAIHKSKLSGSLQSVQDLKLVQAKIINQGIHWFWQFTVKDRKSGTYFVLLKPKVDRDAEYNLALIY